MLAERTMAMRAMGEEVPDEAIVEAFRVLRNDTGFEAKVAAIPQARAAERKAAFEERFAPIAAEHGVGVRALLGALGQTVSDPGEMPAPEPETRGPRR